MENGFEGRQTRVQQELDVRRNLAEKKALTGLLAPLVTRITTNTPTNFFFPAAHDNDPSEGDAAL